MSRYIKYFQLTADTIFPFLKTNSSLRSYVSCVFERQQLQDDFHPSLDDRNKGRVEKQRLSKSEELLEKVH